jgi:protein CWC15
VKLCIVYSCLNNRRQPGQGTESETKKRDLRAQLLEAEAAHFSKTKGNGSSSTATTSEVGSKRHIESSHDTPDAADVEEDIDAKRRRILEETRDIDAESSSEESSEEERCVRLRC